MAANWRNGSASLPGYFSHGHRGTPPCAPMQGLHLQQIFMSKVEAGAAAAQFSNARIAKSNRQSRFGESLSTFDLEDELEGSTALVTQLLSTELEIQQQVERQSDLTMKKAQRKLKKLGIEFKRAEKNVLAVSRKTKLVPSSPFEDLDFVTSSFSRKPVEGTSGRSILPNQPGSKMLSRNDWEEQAYQIIRRQKLRDVALREQGLAMQAQNSSLQSGRESGSSLADTPESLFLPELKEMSRFVSSKLKLFKYLTDALGIKESDVEIIITRSPQVLTQSIEDSLEPRVKFFMVEMGVTKERLAKMVTRHPQLLHYSVEDGICPRLEYLQSISLSKEDILKVFARLPQVLSLSIEKCLKPKYEYLVKELNGGPHTVTSFPAYFSLSLEQRIKPRHRYLVALQRLPKGPFPMKSLAVTDSDFCKQWANTSIEEYQEFRTELLLSKFVRQFEQKNKVQV